jgi:hypothetical protein
LTLVSLTEFHKVQLRTNEPIDSVVPSWNPYFQLENNICTGIWSDLLVDTLAKSRPSATYVEKSELSFESKDGQPLNPSNLPKSRPKSIKVSDYLKVSGGIGITIT